MKYCNRCKTNRSKSEFRKRSALKDGLASICKICNKDIEAQDKLTLQGLIRKMYSHQCYRSKKRGYALPTYTKLELENWIVSQSNFKKLNKAWLKSGGDKMLKPSVDRLDDYKSYTLDNIRLVTWQENKDKYHSDSFNCINTKQCVSINQLDLKSNYLANHLSISSAARLLGISRVNISQCLIGKQKTAGGFKWAYA